MMHRRTTLWFSIFAAFALLTACGDDSSATDPDGGSLGADAQPSGDVCEDTCSYANDGECDDGAGGSTTSACGYGTDCGDCGPRPAVACTPSCSGAECGPDGCGGSCGECAGGLSCAGGSCRDLSFVGRACDTCDADFEADGKCLGTDGTTREMCGSEAALCRRGPERSSGYCTLRCDDSSECPEGYYCGLDDMLDGSGCFFGSP